VVPSSAATPPKVGGVKTVFISSIQRGYEDVRAAARAGVESLGMHPVIAEDAGASPDAPRRALLDDVRRSDIYLLVLGARYGQPGETGRSPTEDEYNEAVRLGKPVIVLKQNVEMEPEQEEFLARTRGSWDQGRLSGSFDGAQDVGLEVVKALRAHEARQAAAVDASLVPDAQRRAHDLASGDEPGGTMSSGSKARFVAVPVTRQAVLDALALDDPALADQLQTLARTSGLVTNAMGLKVHVSGDGVRFEGSEERGWETLRFLVGADGAVVAEGAVGGRGEHFGGSVVMADRLAEFTTVAQRFALSVWDEIDSGHDVREVAVALAVPEAEHKVLAEAEPASSISMPMSMPHVAIAPEPARLVRREDLGSDATTRVLVAELKRLFADAGALQQR
jgi:hypothetical protein